MDKNKKGKVENNSPGLFICEKVKRYNFMSVTHT